MAEILKKVDSTALFKLGYGLYVVTSRYEKDNGLIVNTVIQVTSTPERVAVTVNKANYSHDIICKTGVMNVNCLTTDAPFAVFEAFGFKSGRDSDKFADCTPPRSDNGLVYLPRYINAYISLEVEQYIDLDTHGMFICKVTEARVTSDAESMTYAYYHAHVKPKPKAEKKKGYRCKICGYVYEGDSLPEDFICPICKHGAVDFEPIPQENEIEQEDNNMKKYACTICGWEYDESLGAPELGIAPGTKFEHLPEDFGCPVCGVDKALIKEAK